MSTNPMSGSRPTLILHITTPSAWVQAQIEGIYNADSLAHEGFMHCSTHEQIAATANKHYAGRTGLILLTIDSTRLTAALKYEDLNAGAEYPHIYGPLNLDAVVSADPYEPDIKGVFQPPATT